MRYQNWDVLIFPLVGDAKTPLQEFGTTCTVNQDPGEDSPKLCLYTVTDEYNNRCRSFPEPLYLSSLLHHREGPVADCFVLHTQHPTWVPVPSVVA